MSDRGSDRYSTAKVVESGGNGPGVDAQDALAALAVLSDGVVIQRAGGEIAFCNRAAERILGLSRDQMAGRTSLDPRWRTVHEDGSPFPGETHPAMVALRTGEAVHGVVMGVCRPEGALRWISINADPMPGPDGRAASVVSTFVDVTERVQAEKRYGSLFHEMLNGFALHEIVCDEAGKPVDYRFLAVNPAFEKMTGLKADRILGRSVLEVMPGTEARWIEKYGTVALTGEPIHFEDYAAALERHFAVSAYRPAPSQFATIFADITASKRAEAALRESEEQYRRIVETTHDGVWLIDSGHRTTFVNRRMAEMLGYTPEEMLGEPPSFFMSEGTRREAEPKLELARQGVSETHERRYRRKDGVEIWTLLSTSPFHATDGSYAGALAIVSDITDRKKNEQELRDAHDLLEQRIVARTKELRDATAYNRSLLEASLDPLVTIDQDGRILDVNESTVRATGFPREHLVGSDFSNYFSDPERARDGYRRAFREGSIRDYELQLEHRDGSSISVEYNATVYSDDGGKVLGIFAAARDISARKRFEDELAEANRELEAFSYSVSHELRSPLRAIDGFSALIVQSYGGRLDEEGRRLFGRVRWNAQRMGQLIDDLLSFARTGRTDLEFDAVDMTASARAAFEQVVPDQESRARIAFSVGHLPEARGDAALLRRVWENLLLNAVKFSATRGEPEIHVEGKVEEGEAVYRVRDNGVGFDSKFADKLFGVFQRLHGAREFEGTGVGLALVKRIVTRHGGRVRAEGEVGKGATFSFSLPVAGRSDRGTPWNRLASPPI